MNATAPFGLLSEAGQALLTRLSVFPGGWALESAEAVAGEEDGDVLGTLAELVDSSLVVVEEEAGLRFRMLETIREYAAGGLHDRGEVAQMEERLARRQRELSAQLESALLGPSTPSAFAQMAAELTNLSAAVRWSIAHDDAARAMAVLAPVSHYLWSRGLFGLTHELTEQITALPSAAELPSYSRGRLLLLRGSALIRLGRTGEGVAVLRQLLDEATTAGYEDLVTRTQFALGASLPDEHDRDEARALLDAAVTGSRRRPGDVESLVFALTFRCTMALRDGEPVLAAALQHEALIHAEEVDSEPLRTLALTQLGLIALSEEDVEAARRWFLSSANLMREVRDPDGTLQLLDGFAAVAVALGRPEVAARPIGAARQLRDTSGAAMPLVRPFLDRLERETLDALDRPELRQALAVGAASSPQDALEFARDALAVPA